MDEEAASEFSQTTLDEKAAVDKIKGIAAELRESKAALAKEKVKVARMKLLLIAHLPAPRGTECEIEKHWANKAAENQKKWADLCNRSRGEWY